MSREAVERMTKRIMESSKKQGSKLTEKQARQKACVLAERHDRKKSGY